MFMMLRRAPADMMIASSPLIVERLTSVTTSPFSTWKNWSRSSWTSSPSSIHVKAGWARGQLLLAAPRAIGL